MNTHTTVVIERTQWVEIATIHDQSGSATLGLVPVENIPMLIEGLKKFIGFNSVLADSLPLHRDKSLDTPFDEYHHETGRPEDV